MLFFGVFLQGKKHPTITCKASDYEDAAGMDTHTKLKTAAELPLLTQAVQMNYLFST